MRHILTAIFDTGLIKFSDSAPWHHLVDTYQTLTQALLTKLSTAFSTIPIQVQSQSQTPGSDTGDAPAAAPDSNEPIFDVNEQLGQVHDLLPDWLLPYWHALDRYPVIEAAIIVIVGYLISRLITSVAGKIVRQITSRTKSTLDDHLVDLLTRPLFITIFFYALGLALRAISMSPWITDTLLKILASMVVIVWINALMPAAKMILQALGKLKERFNVIEERTIPLFSIISSIVLLGLGTYALLIVWGINPAAWLASAGVIGIAVGFAAKDTLANLFSGVFIVADTPYKLGDYINLDTGERGMVTHVGLRSTRLLTRDDVEITIPNAIIANAKIINESGGPSTRHRIRIKVGVAYGSDVDQVEAVLNQVANRHPKVCNTPASRVRMRAFGDSSLDFELLCWIDRPADRGLISHELYMSIYKEFQHSAIEIPYPKRDLYIKELPSEAQGGLVMENRSTGSSD